MDAKLRELQAEQESPEEQWLETADALGGRASFTDRYLTGRPVAVPAEVGIPAHFLIDGLR